MHLLGKAVDSVGELLLINEPVTQTRLVIVPVTKPPVIQHEHFNAELVCLVDNWHQLLLSEVHESGFPVVNQDWPLLASKVRVDQVVLVEVRQLVTQLVKTSAGVCHDRFRCLETFAVR